MTTRPYHRGIPEDILAISHERDLLRRKGQYERADHLKHLLEEAGYVVKDNPHGAHLICLPGITIDGKQYNTARQVPSSLDEKDTCTFSVHLLAQNNLPHIKTCVESVLRYAGPHTLEIILVDNASRDELDIWAETLQHRDNRIHLIRASRTIGTAQARNLGFKMSRGQYILLLDPNIEVTGDILAPLAHTLQKEHVGLTGLRGLRTLNLRHFEESDELEVEVIDSTCLAFKRSLLNSAGLLDEGYRHPYFMDVDFCFALRDHGAHAETTPHLPLTCHPGQAYSNLTDAERSRLNKRNFYRYLEKWGDREDLLLDSSFFDEEEYEEASEDEETCQE